MILIFGKKNARNSVQYLTVIEIISSLDSIPISIFVCTIVLMLKNLLLMKIAVNHLTLTLLIIRTDFFKYKIIKN